MSKRNFLFALLIILAAAGCGKKEPDAIKIGAILPLTGDGAKYGESAQKGIELALEEINAGGGIQGKRIVVIYEDSKGDPKTGVSAVQKLISVERVPAIIGDLFSSVTLAVAPLMNQNKVVLLSPASSSPKITTAGDYIFRNVASDVLEGSIMADFAVKQLKLRKLAILYINNEYGVGVKDVFKDRFLSQGGTITSEEGFQQGSVEFKAQLAKTKATNPDAIYIIGYKELAHLLKQAREIRLDRQFLSTVMFEDPEIIEISGRAADGVIYSARAYDPNDTAEVVKNFVASYRKQHNSTPDIFAALSYDALRILAVALKNGAVQGEQIKDALYRIKNFPGVLGDTSFDSNGDVIQPAVIKTVREGNFEIFTKK